MGNVDLVTAGLRLHLRSPTNAVSDTDPPSRHRAALVLLWKHAVSLSGGNIGDALTAATEAVKWEQKPTESDSEYQRRLDGIPSQASGTRPPYSGADKPRDFFRSAAIAFATGSERFARSVGVAWEVKDWIANLVGNTSGYDRGGIRMDSYGAAFGAALRNHQKDPSGAPPDIRDYLPPQQGPSKTGPDKSDPRREMRFRGETRQGD
jgi:hypothetical protein